MYSRSEYRVGGKKRQEKTMEDGGRSGEIIRDKRHGTRKGKERE